MKYINVVKYVVIALIVVWILRSIRKDSQTYSNPSTNQIEGFHTTTIKQDNSQCNAKKDGSCSTCTSGVAKDGSNYFQ